MTNLINCSKASYLARMDLTRGTRDKEHAALMNEVYKLRYDPVCGAPFKNGGNGRLNSPSTWLMALRAHTRGKLALPLLKPKYEGHGIDSRRVPHTAEEKAAALVQQGKYIAMVTAAYPLIFAGMLVDPDAVQERAQEQPVLCEAPLTPVQQPTLFSSVKQALSNIFGT